MTDDIKRLCSAYDLISAAWTRTANSLSMLAADYHALREASETRLASLEAIEVLREQEIADIQRSIAGLVAMSHRHNGPAE